MLMVVLFSFDLLNFIILLLNELLAIYESTSRKVVVYDKFLFINKRNTSRDMQTTSSVTYLGPPSQNARCKQVIFLLIKDRV